MTQLSSGAVSSGSTKIYSSSKVNGLNKIQIKVQLSSSGSTNVGCFVNQHVDNSTSGWMSTNIVHYKVNSSSANCLNAYRYYERLYIPTKAVKYFYDTIGTQQFINSANDKSSVAINSLATILELKYGGAAGILIALGNWGLSTASARAIQSSLRSSIRTYANYTPGGTALYGVCIEVKYVENNGAPSITVERWSTASIRGCYGCTCTPVPENVLS